MLRGLFRAIGQLDDRRVLGAFGWSLLLALLAFAALWTGVWFLLTETELPSLGWVEAPVKVLGGLATIVLTWLLFPVVLTAMLGLFLERVAAAVEQRHYPELPPAPGLSFVQGLAATARFVFVAVALNVALLPLLLFPPVYLPAYYLANGYLIGREYFEMVALRRLDPTAARALRKRHGGELLVTGALMAFALTLPLVNLLVPVLLTAAMVHSFEGWRRARA